MNDRHQPRARRPSGAVLSGIEPAPARCVLRPPYYPWLVLGTACIAAFIGQVDASIVQLAPPTLEQAFDAEFDKVSWAAVGYVLAFASVLPVFARVAEIWGHKLMYLLGFALFGLSSTLCGLAPDLPCWVPTASSFWSPPQARRGEDRQWEFLPLPRLSASASTLLWAAF